MSGIERQFYGSGEVARRVSLPLWKFLYFTDRGLFPEPSIRVAGRRLFTEDDVQRIVAILADRSAQVSENLLACTADGDEQRRNLAAV
jgi:DNA-binding transcriptional MerR regulator